LEETLETLAAAGIEYTGAGNDIEQATAPGVLDAGAKGRVVVFSFGTESAGIPRSWGANEGRRGVDLLSSLSRGTVQQVAERIHQVKAERDVVVASIHWGGNWGYEIPLQQREFAHWLIDEAGVDIVHGHSSHHRRGIEVHRDRLILYGCGDFLNDYEGISGYEEFRDDLVLMYFPRVDLADGKLVGLRMTPLQIRRFQLNRAPTDDVHWLGEILNRECERFATGVETDPDGSFTLRWG
jgi:poly-gamma-glutamate synthesis protein (capsule biosynthesis protein)